MKFQQQSVFVIYIRDQSRFNELACLTSKLLRNHKIITVALLPIMVFSSSPAVGH